MTRQLSTCLKNFVFIIYFQFFFCWFSGICILQKGTLDIYLEITVVSRGCEISSFHRTVVYMLPYEAIF